jgi:putative hydroxymethylpyrimidine transport system substrate-binding protein
MRIRLALGVAVLAASLLGGCGEKSEDTTPGGLERVSLALDFYVNPDHAGIYQALDRGYFEAADLAVSPEVPSDPSAPIKEVATGRVDLAISYEPEVLLARDQGLPVTAVAALVQRPLTSLISLPEAGIATPADLAGKTIATAGIPYQGAFLKAILERVGLTTSDVSEVDVGLNLLPAVLSGRADAMLGGFRNVEGVDLRLRGKDPSVVPVDRLGVPTYDELVLVANSEDLHSRADPVRRFIAALERGTRAAAARPAQATQAILDAGQGLEPKLTAAEVRETLPLLLPAGRKPYGYMDPAAWRRFAAFMAANGLLESKPPISEAVDNDLLPERAP